MNARYYVPSIGRFASADTIVPDPTNPQSMNRFSYVRNNPLKFIDPTGHYECHANNICVDSVTSTWIPTRPPKVTRLWINPDDVTAIQLSGNTNFAFNLGTNNSGLDTIPSYSYSQGFHGGLDALATPGTTVVAGIHGTVAWVSDWVAYTPRYIVIRIAQYTYMLIGHLSAVEPSKLVAGDRVNPNTIVGIVGDVAGDGDHIHVEFWTGKGQTVSTNRMIEPPYQYLSPEVKQQFLALAQNMSELDSRITFHQRSDEQWSSRDDQPRLKYHGSNLNVGQPGYDNPWD